MEMAPESRNSITHLIELFQAAPEKFDFFQAVRLIQNSFAQEQHSEQRKLLGEEVHLPQSLIRFRSKQSLSFASSDVANIRPHIQNDELLWFELTVTFLGLTGPNGVLPDHYTSLIISRIHSRNKDFALRDFLDLFNNRSISFFYQAWQKYRLPFQYERHRLEDDTEDPISTALISLAGHGSNELRERSSFRDEVLISYSGYFASLVRNAASLQQLLMAYFSVHVEVSQFRPRWIYLDESNQSSFSSAKHPQGLNMSLGDRAIVGTKFLDLQSMFRIQIGPLRWVEFLRFLPGMSEMQAVVELTHRFAGPDLDFEIQLLVRADRVPPMQFSEDCSNPLSLGQTTWLGTPDPDQILEDVSFQFGYGGRPMPS